MGKSLEGTLYKMFEQYKSKFASNKKRNEARENIVEENLGQVHPSQLLRMKFEKDIGMISSDGSASDLEEYLSEKPKTFRSSDGFDILEWWKVNSMSIREDECGRKFHSGISHRNQSTTNPGGGAGVVTGEWTLSSGQHQQAAVSELWTLDTGQTHGNGQITDVSLLNCFDFFSCFRSLVMNF
ncbi:hypothetical protein POM88_053922 [Heracleum sosnowskyi]|uniref:HAT C-terminal dimerisation domain-containing protein n=1 Tax=Heracleum sosnowskyi TaxID=360622 RepID=A0AAD8LX77_9APIA|nr:hypothetical protein POM88_053922 [Heracleum sosnowskyi]